METDHNITAPAEVLTGDQKMIAMFAHLSIFFGSLWIPLIFWAIYREKSKFASFHSLQSLFFHIAYVVVIIFIALVFALTGFLTGMFKHSGAMHPSPNMFMIIIMGVFGLFVLAFILGSMGMAIYLGISAYKGETKKYPIVGNIIYKKIYGAS